MWWKITIHYIFVLTIRVMYRLIRGNEREKNHFVLHTTPRVRVQHPRHFVLKHEESRFYYIDYWFLLKNTHFIFTLVGKMNKYHIILTPRPTFFPRSTVSEWRDSMQETSISAELVRLPRSATLFTLRTSPEWSCHAHADWSGSVGPENLSWLQRVWETERSSP